MDIWEKIKYEFHKGDSAVKQIITVNLAVFIFTILVGVVATVSGFHSSDLLKYFAVPSDIGTLLMRPWSLVTNIFFHSGFWHLLGNMLLLFFLGRILEDFLSTKKIWHIFIFGGLSGVVLFIASYNLFPVFSEVVSEGNLRGASGGVTAIIVATGVYLPRYQIRPFNLFNIEMRWVALLFVFRDLYSFPGMQNLGGI
ncbi:MAG: membrane associated rhomboid family serine protease, partial [Flavobacteriales bacterium]